mgnify:CR=1 FL=1
MSKSSPLFYLYLVIGAAALILTWVHIPSYMGSGVVDANVQFWKDALVNANPASTFLAVDILFLALAVEIWMVVESRRLGMKYVWLYIAIATFTGISFAVPLYLAMREKHLQATHNDSNLSLKSYDLILLILLGVITLSTGVWLYIK